jgi:hypothetical protein
VQIEQLIVQGLVFHRHTSRRNATVTIHSTYRR